MAFTFDRRIGRYRDAESGRFVSEARIRVAVDQLVEAASARMAGLTARLGLGEIRLAEWQAEMMRTVKESHVAAGLAAAGGRPQMTPSTYGFLGHEIRSQYAYLRDFAAGLEAGRVGMDGRLLPRAGLYGQHARVTYEALRRRDQAERGYRFEKNVLHARESCAQCVALAARGWVAIGSLPPIGSRSCLARCRCTLSYRQAAFEVVA